jgi:NADH dehydrogenase
MNVFLTGGSGFVGSHMLVALQAAGHGIRVLAREPSRVHSGGGAGQAVEVVGGDVVTGEGLDDAVHGCDAVIHLVGIIMESGGATFEKVHGEGTRNVVAAARKQGVERLVLMSALGARAGGVSRYQTTKWRAE